MTEQLRRVLVIMAHPDDPEFCCGGTLARWIDEGKEVCYLLATSGDGGSVDAAVVPGQVSRVREAEQRAAADVLGVQEIIFLRHRDGELVADLWLRLQLVRCIRLCRPDIVVTTDPLRFYVGDRRLNHPDHRAVGEAALGAIFPVAGTERFYPELWGTEGLAPHSPQEIYIAEPDEPNCTVDVAAYIEQKVRAIREHKSQLSYPAAQLARARQRTATADGGHSERFRRIVLR